MYPFKEDALKSFAELDLIEPLRRTLAAENYVTPTEIQAKTIPHAMAGRDVLGCAQTGTGKTAAFALPVLNQLGQRPQKAQPNAPRVLVLAPTRELAIQIADSFSVYGKHLHLKQALVFGGVSQSGQVKALRRGAHIVVATPGRLLDLMNQGHVDLKQLEMFILDEADRMLDMGFLPDLKRIIAALPAERQSLFFSATVSPKIQQLAQSLLRKPATVNVTPKNPNLKAIEQRVLFVEQAAKKKLLHQLLEDHAPGQTLVFMKTKRGANRMAEQLARGGFKTATIHGNKSQSARQQALDSFRKRHVRVLVATDVAARGIDVDGISLVVNFELPQDAENYVHRIGRTGRAGASGVALSLCSADERILLRDIERLIGQRVDVDADHPAPRGSESSSPSSGGTPKRGRNQNRSRKPYRTESTSGAPKSANRGRSRRRRNRSDRPAKAV